MPESDPGDGEINDIEEFLREFDRVEYDDTLVDLVGQGYDVNAPGDQAVADLLGAWRDDVGRVPVDESRFPSAHTARGELPSAPTQGGPVSAQEESARLVQLSQSTNSKGMVQQIIADLNSVLSEVTNALGSGHSRLADAQAPIQEMIQAAETLGVMLDGGFDMLREIGQSIG